MSGEFLFDVRRSLAAGLALRIAGAALVICVIAFAFIHVRFAAESQRALLAAVDTDIAGLVDVYHDGGQAGLVARISDRIALTPMTPERLFYRLEGADGHVLAGNLGAWPALSPATSQQGFIATPDGSVLARATLLKGGLRLVVGRSAAARQSALDGLLRLFVVASALLVLAAFGAGLFAARGLQRRVTAVSEALNNVQQGQLGARVGGAAGRDELGRLSFEVNLMLDRVENLVAAQRDVTDNIAHETRTPLMQLDASLRKAQDACHEPEVQAELDKGRAKIRGMLRLYDSLLDIAATRGQRGDTASLSDIDLSAVAESLAELYNASAEEAGIRLEAHIEPGVVMRADPMQMSHLIVNLLDNAFKYGRDGGYIGFEVRSGPVIVVEDCGPGVAAGDRDAVFRRYHRTGDNASPGHGLGLALVKAIASRHDLTVRVEDLAPGADSPGARFIVTGERPG